MNFKLLILGFALLSSQSCDKKVHKTISSSVSHLYKADDKSRAKATFTDNGKEKTITIEANKTKFILDYKKDSPEGEWYERNSISAKVTKDSLFIFQDDQEIHLGKEL